MSTDWEYGIPEEVIEQHAREIITWQGLAEQIQNQEGLDPELRATALAAIPLVQKQFGVSWPFKAWQAGHPFVELWWGDMAPWTRQQLTDLTGAMSLVACLHRWQGLRSRLRLAGQAVGATFELGLAARALKVGLQVELEPAIPGHRADLAIYRGASSSEALYVEAKHIQPFPKRAYDVDDLFRRVLPIFPWGLQCGGQFFRAPLPDEMPLLFHRVDAFWAERRKNRTRGDLVIEGMLQLWAAPRDDHEAEGYYVSRGFPPARSCTSPPVTFDAFERITNAICGKSQQLPLDHGGMIALETPVEPELLQVPSEALAEATETAVRDLPSINAVALIHRSPSPGPPTHEVRDLGRGHVSVRAPRFLIYSEEVILVRNPRRIYAAADEIVECLFTI